MLGAALAFTLMRWLDGPITALSLVLMVSFFAPGLLLAILTCRWYIRGPARWISGMLCLLEARHAAWFLLTGPVRVVLYGYGVWCLVRFSLMAPWLLVFLVLSLLGY